MNKQNRKTHFFASFVPCECPPCRKYSASRGFYLSMYGISLRDNYFLTVALRAILMDFSIA